MSKARDVALELAKALPEDADFDDLDEFLWERVDVENGRDDFVEGRIRSSREIMGEREVTPEVGALNWSESAAESYLKSLDHWSSTSSAELTMFESATLQALESLVASRRAGITLPEMGDASIQELRVRVNDIAYRIIHDVRDDATRILLFTDSRTCYRNMKGYPKSGS